MRSRPVLVMVSAGSLRKPHTILTLPSALYVVLWASAVGAQAKARTSRERAVAGRTRVRNMGSSLRGFDNLRTRPGDLTISERWSGPPVFTRKLQGLRTSGERRARGPEAAGERLTAP